ncbi:MAG: DUF819 family protein [Phycisphaerae bacterium]|nr:DUF819 family protein [Phycisphaerae bacterium]
MPAPGTDPLVQDPAGVLAILLTVLAIIFWMTTRPASGRVFKVIPALVFCYFVPTALSTGRIIPVRCELYEWVKGFVLPASLLLLTLSLDVKGILRLGPKAVIMLLAGTAGVVVGGPVALAIWQGKLPDEAWRMMSYLAGSWIGGGANAVALQKTFGASDAAISPIIVVDVAVANVWMGVLLFLAGRHARVDRWFGGDTSAIVALERRMEAFQERVSRIPTLPDQVMILALGFGFAWLAHVAGARLLEFAFIANLEERGFLNAFGWKIVIVTTVGVLLSFTRARWLEGAGASRIGSVMIYLLVACIGAGADFRRLLQGEAGYYLLLGVTWMLIHIVVLLAIARLIRAPFFFVAVGSQANIGGAASAPVVAGAFNPALAPVGVLLAIAGYVLGTYAGWVCIQICRVVVRGS